MTVEWPAGWTAGEHAAQEAAWAWRTVTGDEPASLPLRLTGGCRWRYYAWWILARTGLQPLPLQEAACMDFAEVHVLDVPRQQLAGDVLVLCLAWDVEKEAAHGQA